METTGKVLAKKGNNSCKDSKAGGCLAFLKNKNNKEADISGRE